MEPRINEPLDNEVFGKMNDILRAAVIKCMEKNLDSSQDLWFRGMSVKYVNPEIKLGMYTILNFVWIFVWKKFMLDNTYRYSKVVIMKKIYDCVQSNDLFHLVFFLKYASVATTNDRRSEGRECNLKGSKWKPSEQVKKYIEFEL